MDDVDPPSPVALAVGAHPDDIEILMAGTLLRLRDAGARIHMWSLANGCCGSATLKREAIAALRWSEAAASARLAGAALHPPLVDDLEIVYAPPLLARVAAVVRAVRPTIILTHSPQDYMEDHQETSRLIVTAAFARGMRNARATPATAPWDGATVIYHALPHGLRDGLRRVVRAERHIDIAPQLAAKRAMLACHASQLAWLDQSQGGDSGITGMERVSAEAGRRSGRFTHAEGWRRHHHLGFADEGADPMAVLLGDACRIDPTYERTLEDP